MDEQRVASFYDAVGSGYDRALYFLACDPLYEEEIARLMRGRRLRRIVELGCGTGKQTVLLAPQAEEVLAFDLSAESLRQAEARCARAGLGNVAFRQQSIVSLPSTAVRGRHLFLRGCHLARPRRIPPGLRGERADPEAGRIMGFEVDGKWELDMLLHNPEERARAWATKGTGHLRIWQDIPCKTFTDRELRAVLGEAGLRVTRVRGVNIFHCLLPEGVLMSRPHEVGAGWRLASEMLRGLDALIGAAPGAPRLASTRLVSAVRT